MGSLRWMKQSHCGILKTKETSEALRVARPGSALVSQMHLAQVRHSPWDTQSQHKCSGGFRSPKARVPDQFPVLKVEVWECHSHGSHDHLVQADHGSHVTLKGVSGHFIFDGLYIIESCVFHWNLVIWSHCGFLSCITNGDSLCHAVKPQFEKQWKQRLQGRESLLLEHHRTVHPFMHLTYRLITHGHTHRKLGLAQLPNFIFYSMPITYYTSL